MKYIRTKDGRIICYEVINETDMSDDFIYGYGAVMKGKKEGFEIEEIANTIEELCDEFVVIRNNDKYVCDYIGEEPYYLAIEHDGDGHYFSKKELLDLIVYGAIWTDMGLIYVAKMNEKGELELL